MQEELRITFAPGVLSAIEGDGIQRAKAEKEGFNCWLGDMDAGQAEIARHAVFAKGIKFCYPLGYLVFKTPEDRLQAIHAIHNEEPQELGWKWRKIAPQPDMDIDEYRAWIRQQPIEEQYLTEISLDPDRA